jgi:hypothetical protein
LCTRFFVFFPFFEMASSGPRRADVLEIQNPSLELRIYHPERREGIMGGMRFHDVLRGTIE